MNSKKLPMRLYELRIAQVSEIDCVARKAGLLVIKRKPNDELIQITFNPTFILKIGFQERVAWKLNKEI